MSSSATPAKSGKVTKAQLEASGYDNLRDYMNAQQGLSRKSESYSGKGGSGRGGQGGADVPGRTAADRIPTPSPRSKAYEGESASGSELGRNIKNTLAATAGLSGVRLAQAASEGMTASRAAAAADAARKADLAAALRKGTTPTKFTSSSRAAPKNTRRAVSEDEAAATYKKGGVMKKYAAGGSVSSASSRADGIATKGKTRGRIC